MSESIEKYINTDELSKLIDLWSKSGTSNNHTQLVAQLSDIRRISKTIIDSNTHNETFTQFYTKIVNSTNIKLVYRCLNLQKINITVPTLHILSHIATYNISIFINAFDLSSNILPKLLVKNNHVRQEFIKFWIHLNTTFGYFDRSQQFGNKVWTNVFKTLTDDSGDIILSLIEFIDVKVLQEPNFKKSTKLKFINEDCLFNLSLVVSKFDYTSLFNKIIDGRSGILFIEPPNTTVTVNNQNFKINNKVLFNLLKFMKIDRMETINIAISILSKDNNLICPYMNHLLINGGYHEPNLTNWYMCHSLLYIKVLQLKSVDLSHILLKPLSKAVLVKGIQSASGLIVQLNLQFIYLILKKLQRVERPAVNKILKSISEISDILNITPKNEVSKLLILKILEVYSKFQPSLNNQLNKFVGDSLNNLLSDFNKLNLIQLNLMISIQLNLSVKFEVKQTNLIVKIINFSKLDDSPLFYYNMVNKLTTVPSITLLNPLFCFIKLNLPSAFDNVLNQSLLRFNTSVYKYHDMDFELNVFTKILLEQAHHAVKKDPSLLEHVQHLVHELILIGESANEMKRLVDSLHLKVDTKVGFVGLKMAKSDYELLNCIHNISLVSDSKAIDEFTKVSNYIINNPNFAKEFANVKLFRWTVACCNTTEKLSRFNELLLNSNISPSVEVSKFIFDELVKGDDLVGFNWMLERAQLNSKQVSQDIQLLNYQYLLSSNRIPDISIDELFLFKTHKKFEVIKSKLTEFNIGCYIDQIVASKEFNLFEGIELDETSVNKIIDLKLSNEDLCEIGSVIKSNTDLSVFFKSFGIENNLGFDKLVNLYANKIKCIDSEIDISTLIKSAPDFTDTFTVSFIELIKHTQAPTQYEQDLIKDWTTKSMIYITKQFAELSELPGHFEIYLSKFIELFPLTKVPLTVLNTQLEVVLNSKFINSSFIHYMSKVVVAHNKIDINKLLTIFINNPNNSLNELPNKSNATIRIESSLIIYNLFNMGASPQILDNLLFWYNGSTYFEDLIIKKILIKLEEIKGTSWMSRRWNWEINEFSVSDFDVIGDQKLFSNDLISLNKHFIINCLNRYEQIDLPGTYSGIVNVINDKIYLFSYDFNETVYDYEFLILLILNNEEFFKFGDGVNINMKNIVEYHILELLVRNYHNPISKVVLSKIIKHIDEDLAFKDKALFKIYVSSLLNSGDLKPIQLNIYSKLVTILSNPGHHLYEFVYKYVLSHPKVGETELPLFSKVKSENPKTIEWYLTGIDVTSGDLPLLNMNEFFEWILNLVNLPNSKKLAKVVLRIVFKVPEINNGTVSLVTRYGILSYLEQLCNEGDLTVNLGEISDKLGLTVTKRVLEWTSGDVFSSNKRIKLNGGDSLC